MEGGGGLKWGGMDIHGGGISRQVKFAAVNCAVGNFAQPPGFSVVPSARVHNAYCEKFAENP